MRYQYVLSCLLGSSFAVLLAVLVGNYWPTFVRRRTEQVEDIYEIIHHDYCLDKSCYMNTPVPFPPLSASERGVNQGLWMGVSRRLCDVSLSFFMF